MNQQSTAYLRTRVLSASPEELRLMLLEGALRFARMGRDGLTEKNYEKSFDGINQAQQIVLELINMLKPEHAPELCDKLTGLYTFLYTRLVDACTQRDPAIVDEVIKILEYECETWVLLMKQLEQENKDSSAAAGSLVNNLPTPITPVNPMESGSTLSLEG